MIDNFVISDDLIRKILKKHNLGNLISFEENKTGFINPVFIINKQFVLRINSNEKMGNKLKFAKESFLYSFLPGFGVPTPECIAYDMSHEVIEYDYLILSYLPGETLTSAFAKADSTTCSRLSFELGEIARKIHSVDIQPLLLRSDLFNLSADWSKAMEEEFDLYFNYIKNNNLLSEEVIQGIESVSKEYNLLGSLSPQYGLVHGDFSRDNIQVNNGQIIGIFDFEMAQIGDPLYDLQKLPINFQLGTRFDRVAFLAGYGLKIITKSEKIRLNRYAISQGLWEIWATSTKTFPFGEREIQEGTDLIINSI